MTPTARPRDEPARTSTAAAGDGRRKAAGIVARLGGVLVRPRATLARVLAGEGGVADVAALMALRVVAGEAGRLLRAVAGVGTLGLGGSFALVLQAVSQVVPDALAIVVGAVAMMVLSGRRGAARARGRELDLAACAWVPSLAVEVAAALGAGALGRPLAGWAGEAAQAGALLWAVAVWAVGLVLLRSHGAAAPGAVPSVGALPGASDGAGDRALDGAVAPSSRAVPRASGVGAAVAGSALVGALAVTLAINLVAVARAPERLSPGGAGGVAPDFTLPLVDGGRFRLGADRVPTLIDFWATWCAPCREELPVVDRLATRYRARGLRVIAVDAEGREAEPAVRALLASAGVHLPVALDGAGVASRFGVDLLPHLALVGADGRIRRVFLGLHDEGEIAAALDVLLAAPAVAPR